ncbi:MAG: hypothetical protein GF307_07805 [candidate division Zixibacteria bacterium]|nr:hypothetical protein [candidate division Zixibacteria bacterium]
MMRYLLIFLSLAVSLIPTQNHRAMCADLTVDEIIAKTKANSEEEKEKWKDIAYQFTEKIVSGKIDNEGKYEEVDTVISVVTIRGEEEIERRISYATSEDAKKRQQKDKKDKDNKENFGAKLEIGDPAYNYQLIGETDTSYIISVKPRTEKPDKGQVDGVYHIDKEDFRVEHMDFVIPRPEKLKEAHITLNFQKLENGAYVPSTFNMVGRVKALLGIVDISFKLGGDYYDYRIVEDIPSEEKPAD